MLLERPVCLSCPSVTLVYCGQTAGWIKMKLGMEVGFGPPHLTQCGQGGPVHIDGWGPSSPSPKREQSPQFSAVSTVARLLDGSICHLAWS